MDYNCLRCGCEMRYISREFIRLSPQTLLDSLAVENLEADIYVCPNCRKIDFFATDCLVPSPVDESAETVTCASCGRQHVYGAESCPYCGRKYIRCPQCDKLHDAYVSFCPNCRYEYRKSRKKKEKEPWEL